MKQKVDKVTLDMNDFHELEDYLRSACGLDSLDVIELIMKIESMKNVEIDYR